MYIEIDIDLDIDRDRAVIEIDGCVSNAQHAPGEHASLIIGASQEP